MAEEKDIELRTEDVNEILTAPPKWLYRWGITIIFLTIVLGIVLSYFISYPDTLTAKATITTLNPPINLVAKTTGKLSHLLVKNNEVVKKNDVIGVVENTANYKEVIKTGDDIDTLLKNIKINDSLPYFQFSDTIKLGDLTTGYLTFLKSYKDYKLFTEINPQQQQIILLNNELANYNILLSKYEKQAKIYGEEFVLIEQDYKRDFNLFKDGTISAREFENKKKEYLRAQSGSETQKITFTNTKITINNIEKSKLQLRIQYLEQLNKYKLDLEQSAKNLQTSITTWKQNYLLIAPIDGKVSFFNYWHTNQNIKAGDDIFSIVPSEKQTLIARLILPSQNSGKVKAGQTVNIKLDNYPYTEYGIVKGIIKGISLVPNNNAYSIDVQLPNSLTTSYNKTLTYKEEMTGTGEIITENMTLLNRLFNKFKAVIDKK
jgi:multidrug resistance efflux pump